MIMGGARLLDHGMLRMRRCRPPYIGRFRPPKYVLVAEWLSAL